MEILGLDHVELYVDDLDRAIGRFAWRFGLEVTGRARGDAATFRSVSLGCGSTSLVLTAPAAPDDPVADFLGRHDEGVAHICLRVRGVPREARVQAFGDVTLTLVARSDAGVLPDGYEPVEPRPAPHPRIQGVDHLAVCLPAGELEPTAARWTGQLGFVQTFDERVAVGGQAMDSIVVQDPAGALVLTLLCQDPTRAPGQIARFVEANDGAGVQHVAFRTSGIIDEVDRMRARGIEFLAIPDGYYEKLLADADGDTAEIEHLQELGILRDRDPWGTILQVFTRSTHRRDTLFFELVERRGARTFGAGNIKALYEAVGRTEPTDSLTDAG